MVTIDVQGAWLNCDIVRVRVRVRASSTSTALHRTTISSQTVRKRLRGRFEIFLGGRNPELIRGYLSGLRVALTLFSSSFFPCTPALHEVFLLFFSFVDATNSQQVYCNGIFASENTMAIVPYEG